nr:hemicentin-2-like [Nerophis lumbriciformis]
MRGFLVLLVSAVITGSVSLSRLTLNVSKEVKVLRGQDALLGCNFTHPMQANFIGNIQVSWSREAGPFFACEVNSTAPEPYCLNVEGYSLVGDLRQGVSWLLIKKALLQEGVYFCKVNMENDQAQEQLTLKVQVMPSILSLSLVNVGPGNQTRLQCVAEGNPLPDITWLSESGRPLALALAANVRTSLAGPNRLSSSVPYEQQGELTCRAKSDLGQVELKHRPPISLRESRNQTAVVCAGVAAALLMLVAVVVLVHRLMVKGEVMMSSERDII